MDTGITTNEWLARELERQHISKHELVRRTGVSYSTIIRMLTRPNTGNLATWIIICNALGASVFDIYE